MNKVYRLIWNELSNTFVAVAENVKGRGKRASTACANRSDLGTMHPGLRIKILAALLALIISPAFAAQPADYALPSGGTVTAGTATISQSGARMDINQSSQRTAINWNTFDIGAAAQVNFNQPGSSAVALNRVLSSDPSSIFGKLTANGQVFLLNPNGVLFGTGSHVDVGGLVATTMQLSDADFMAGSTRFTRDGNGSIVNQGTITARDGGYIALLAPTVENDGILSARLGTVALAAGDAVTLQMNGDSLISVQVDPSSVDALVRNKQLIQADGGQVFLTASAAQRLAEQAVPAAGNAAGQIVHVDGVTRLVARVDNSGVVSSNGGAIHLAGDFVTQLGTLDASGTNGGSVSIAARAILDAGIAQADGSTGSGGNITLNARESIIQTAAAFTSANGSATGGTVHLQANNNLFSSGTLSATGQQGGTIDAVGQRVVLAAATLDASGATQGGLIRVGGDFHGVNPALPNAQTTLVNGATTLKADGGNGQVVVWSDQQTDYYGGIGANKAGRIEVSSLGTLNYAGQADAGVGGSLLLDPANITITSSGGPAAFALLNPNEAANNQFGSNAAVLGTTTNGVFTDNGKIAVAVSNDSLAASNAGAVYLFNTTNGALISTLTGGGANDQVGSAGIVALNNGNFVVRSTLWNNSTGAVTWGSGSTGISGTVSAGNSLIGSTANDQVGSGGVTALSNGNYVVSSSLWDGAAVDLGAVTWGNGTTGTIGVISASNSLVGSTANDQVGDIGVTALNNGNYVVLSSLWDGAAVDAGAATWGNGATGISGAVTISNSLVGSAAGDQVGIFGATALNNGNYVVRSPFWNNGDGAVTWGSGTAGAIGAISASNSLVGSTANDQVGNGGITALSNGNYVVNSPSWDNGAVVDAGAVAWGNGTAGTIGAISASNSLVGSTANDQVGNGGITALSNGNYVVNSWRWNNGAVSDAGAVTWGNGASGISGAVSASNSLVGSSAFDAVGWSGVTALSNGNYVVLSSLWDGAASNTGAATWGSGTSGISGAVSASNSLVGSAANDQVGNAGVTALSNGNYVVLSSLWDGAASNTGAATWGSGTSGISGAVSASNSLVGSAANDQVGNAGVTALSNGNYVVLSSLWDGAASNTGAATWGSGTSGISGAVSASNSLVGSAVNDQVGNAGVTALSNGNYVVRSTLWNNGAVADAGAVTWGNGATGSSGTISASNSLVGSTANDQVGDIGVSALSNGNYVVRSSAWDHSAVVDAGQILIGTPGNISFANGQGQNLSVHPDGITSTLASGTAVTLQASNDITVNSAITVGGAAGGAFTLQAGRNINLNANITTANGNFTAIAGDAGADSSYRSAGTPTLTLGAGVTLHAGAGNVTLVANGGNLINNSGFTTPISAHRWLVYSSDPAADTKGGMSGGFKRYNCTWTGGCLTAGTSIPGTGNGFLYSVAPVLSVTPGTQSATYGDALASFTPGYSSGFIDGDTSGTAGLSGTASFSVAGPISTAGHYTAGNHDVSYASGLASSLGYQFQNDAASTSELTMNAKTLNITGVTALNRAYDGTLTAALGGTAAITALGADVVNLGGSGSGVFANKNAGTAKGVTVTGYTTSGADAGNYTLVQPAGLTANITQAALTVSANTVTKTYDGTLSASGTGTASSLAGTGAGETISNAGSQTFLDKNAGLGNKTVRASGLTIQDSGNVDVSGNYAVTYVDNTTSTITPYAVNLSGGRAYDGTANIAAAALTMGALAGSETLTLSGTGTVANKNVGTAKVVTLGSLALGDGTGLASNYTFSGGTQAVNITQAALTLSTSNVSRTYDGGLSALGTATVTGGTLYSGDTLSGGTFAYTDKNAGSGNKTVTASGVTLNDTNGGGNYAVSYASNTTSTITPYAVNLNGSRAYDGTANIAAAALTMGALAGSETLTLSGTGTVANKNVGTAKVVTLGSLALGDGSGLASNYTFSGGTQAADITAANLTLSTSNVSKTYDGGLSALGTATVTGGTLYSGDTLSGGTFAYTDKNAGSGNKTVTTSGVTVNDSNGGGNYAVSYANNTTSTITAANLTLSTSNVSKTYDGGLSALGTATVTGGTLFSGDTLSGGTFAFLDKNAGSGNKTVTASGVTLNDTNGGGNYAVSYASNTTSTITPYAVNLNGSRAYDGTANIAAAALTMGALAGSETLTLSGTGTVANKNVGTAKVVTLGSLALGDGSGLASNYTFSGGTQAADITAANLTLSTSNVSKTYDGGLSALGTAAVTGGTLFSGDTLSGGTFAFTDKNAGSGNKTVTASGVTLNDTNGGGNYAVSYASNTTSTITPYAVNLSGSRAYDGTANIAAAALTMGALAGSETLTLSGAGTVANKNVGTAKAVTLGSLALGDGSGLASNYTFSGGTQAVNITQAALTVSTSNVSKTYDGGLTAAGTATVTGGTLFSGDTLSGGTFAFTDKNAGSGNKTVTASGVTLNDTNGGGNYAVSYASNTTSTITPKAIAVSGITADTKVYDGTTSATLNLGTVGFGGIISGDVVSITAGSISGNFANKNVGNTKAINLSGVVLGGGDAGNYTLNGVAGVTGAITAANLTLNTSDITKTYDGGLTAAGTATVTGGTLFSGDTLSGGTFAFTDKNAGSGNKTVTTSGVTVNDSNGGGNYAVSYANNTTSTITAANLTLSTSNVSKTYDGGLSALGTATVTGGTLFSGDTLSGGTFAFTDKNAGSGNKTVTTSGVTLNDTNGGGNYAVSYASNTTSTITPYAVNLSGSRAYDGTANIAAAALTMGALVGSETLTLSGTGTVANKNVGTAKAVTLGSLALGNGSGLASNYTFSGGTQMADITPAPLIVTANNLTRAFGSADPQLTYSTSGLASGDTAGSALSGTLSRTAGETSGVYSISQGNLSSSNYSLTFNAGMLRIVPLVLTGDSFIFPTLAASPSSPSIAFAQAAASRLLHHSSFRTTEAATPVAGIFSSSAPAEMITIVDGGILVPDDFLTDQQQRSRGAP